jgi:hypothetical protein
MKYGLLVYESIDGIINVGDYIQSLAARQFIDAPPIYVNREHLDEYRGEDICLFMNGWFMHYSRNFPPAKNIHPIFVSFHINKLAKDMMLTGDVVEYLRLYEPIGCRDIYTLQLLSQRNIRAYFSGCLTLTLGITYRQTGPRENIYIIDPYIGSKKNIKNITAAVLCFMYNTKKLYKLTQIKCQKATPMTLLSTSLFYSQYSKIWDDDVLLNAIYIGHYIKFIDDTNSFKCADELLKKYANAKLIITSRLHAALPAVGMNTPCVLVYPENSREEESCRFDGLLDLVNVITHTGTKIKNDFQIDPLNPSVKKTYISIKEELLKVIQNKLDKYRGAYA